MIFYKISDSTIWHFGNNDQERELIMVNSELSTIKKLIQLLNNILTMINKAKKNDLTAVQGVESIHHLRFHR